MRLYLIRHGKAERQSDDGLDESRRLTKRGKRQAVWLAERLCRGTIPGRILSSPAARALETAELIAGRLGLEVGIEEQIGLGAGPSGVIDLISTLAPTDVVALVGHNPTMSVAASLMLYGAGGTGGLELRTGQAAALEIPDPGAALGGGSLVDLLRMPKG